jgi:predicted N-acetyltransferase YhbS
MNSSATQIRSATFDDRDPILAVHRDAFGDEEGEASAALVAEMLDDPTAKPIHSFVAEQACEIIAHVLFTAVRIEPSDVPAQIIAPLAVSPDHQQSGLGTKLVNEALTQLESQGVELIFVLGYPKYYSRFGFAPAGVQGFDAPYPILPKNADAWMVKELQPGAIENSQGTVRCCKALDQPQYWQK